MKHYNTFAETENILQIAINMRGHTVKDIAAATGIKADTLYKWKTTEAHLSPAKADALLLYFIQNEPQRLELAETVLAAKNNTI
jgi:transposase-like protein